MTHTGPKSAPPPVGENACISLVGIAGAGKSTLAPLLASTLGWQHLDTDRLIEAYYGRPLDEVYQTLGREDFLACEAGHVSRLGASRMVVSTGGSVVYSPAAVARLRLLGPVVWLRVSPATFLARVDTAQGRGFARAPGQELADVHAEREPLYAACCDLAVDTDTAGPQACVNHILSQLTFTDHS